MSDQPARSERDQSGSAPSEGSVRNSRGSAALRRLSAVFVAAILAMSPALAAGGEGLTLSDAWVPAAPEIGRDIPLMVTIKNETTAPEALLRVRCPVANFSERHTVDRGEGAPAMRSIPNIPIPAGSTLVLLPTAYHVMLLQTREPLEPGKRFTCTIVFQKAGSIETEVEVRKSP
ncbi:copper chaperone PCu(A)C [Bradyrhizobium oligotrophicum]|uniref:copper chaperone PCu(A)C n=1 Tax=Bradyrhizobium oligotrophicum TaxID=44255 RepID=UPI003EBB7D1B